MENNEYTQDDNIISSNIDTKDNSIIEQNLNIGDKTSKKNSIDTTNITNDNQESNIKDHINNTNKNEEANDNNEQIFNRKKVNNINSKVIELSSQKAFAWLYKLTQNKTRNIMAIGFIIIGCFIIYLHRVIESRNLENNKLERSIERLEKMSIFQSNELLKYMQEEKVQKSINSKNLNLKRLDNAPYIIEIEKDF